MLWHKRLLHVLLAHHGVTTNQIQNRVYLGIMPATCLLLTSGAEKEGSCSVHSQAASTPPSAPWQAPPVAALSAALKLCSLSARPDASPADRRAAPSAAAPCISRSRGCRLQCASPWARQ